MKNEIVNDVLKQMMPYLYNTQKERLRETLEHAFYGYDVKRKNDVDAENNNNELVGQFIEAKRKEKNPWL